MGFSKFLLLMSRISSSAEAYSTFCEYDGVNDNNPINKNSNLSLMVIYSIAFISSLTFFPVIVSLSYMVSISDRTLRALVFS